MTAPPSGDAVAPTVVLHQARDFSRRAVQRLRGALSERAGDLQALSCVAVAGSLARDEAGPASDVDCVIVVRPEASASAQRDAVARVFEAIRQSGLRAPRADGIFTSPVTAPELLDPAALGVLDEAPAVYGKRLQLLTDARPVLNPEAFRRLRFQVLEWFVRSQPADRPFFLLASELIRYRRSYWAYQYFRFNHDADDSWRLRMAKLGASRRITIAGLLFLVGEGTRHNSPVDWVAERLTWSALERVLNVMNLYAPGDATRLEACYADVHAVVAAPDRRQALVEGEPVRAESLAASGDARTLGSGLDPLVDELGALVNDFLLARRGDWPAWLYQAMLL